MQTLDGFMEGPNGELDWHDVDEEYNDFSVEQLNNAGTLLFGRKTFELMVSYWTSEQAFKADPVVAGKMNSIQKMVCSATLSKVDWNNTTLISQDIYQTVAALKNNTGAEILVLGSAQLAASLLGAGLVDELRLIVVPVCIGSGKTLLGALPGNIHFQFIQSRKFCSGKIMLTYKPNLNRLSSLPEPHTTETTNLT
jgi:dihydrofolate reductase